MRQALLGKVWNTGETLVVLEGADVAEWLQGQVTQDVHAIGELGSAGACFCLVTGQLEALATVHRMAGGRWGVSTTQPAVVQRRVEEFVILESVAVQAERGPVLHTHSEPPVHALWSGLSRRLGEPGWDFILPPDHTLAQLSEAESNVLTLEHGVPLFGTDTDEKTLPPELGPDFELSHISYDKGCYIGQEVLMRVHSRGRTRRTWSCLRTEAVLALGTELQGPTGEVVGRVTRSALSPEFGPLAAAYMRDAWCEPGTRVSVSTGDSQTNATVVRFPRRLGP